MTLAPWKKSYEKARQHIKKQRHYFADKGPYSQSYSFSSSQMCMWELYHKEGWGPKNWCFWTVVLEQTLESSLYSKEIKLVNPKENQPWIFIGRTDLKLKLQYLGHLMQRADSLEKTLFLGKIEGKRWRRWQMMRWLDNIIDSMHMSLNQLWERVKERESWCAPIHGIPKSQKRLSSWTTTISAIISEPIHIWGSHLIFYMNGKYLERA